MDQFMKLPPGQKAAVEKSLARDTEQAADRAALPVVAFPNLRAACNRLIEAGAVGV